MITLYHCKDARSFRILWMLEELKLDYRLETMAFPPRVNAPGYLEHHPVGNVPFRVDGDERLFDSGAMLIYLASRGGGRPGLRADEPGFGEWLSWIAHGEADLTMPLAAALRYSVFVTE